MREYTPEEVAMIDRVSRDNAIKWAMQLEACKIFPSLAAGETSHFVIVRCLKSDADPFMVAEVISNNNESNRLCLIWIINFFCNMKMVTTICTLQNRLVVQWWAPTPLSRQKQRHFNLMTFSAEMDKTRIINRQRGGPMWKLNPKTQTLNHNTVHFGFNNMTTDGRLPPEVLRKVRDLGLLPEGTKIKRL